MIRIYRQLFTAQFQAAAQYRIQFILWMLFSVIRPTIFLAAWVAVANAQGGAVSGYTASAFAGYYVALTLVGHLTAAWDFFEFEFEIRQGRLAPKLLRPLHPLHYAIVQAIVFKLSTLPILAVALALLAWTFGARFDGQPIHYVLFVPSVILGWLLNFMIGWCVASSAFWLQRVHTVTTIMQRIAFMFAGQIAPIALMPAALQAVCWTLPFAYTLAVPTMILRGDVSPDQALLLMAGQAVWLGISFVAFQAIWRAGLRQFSAVGA